MREIQQVGSGIEYGNTGDLVEDAKLIIDSAQRSAHQAVSVALVVRNWLLGRRIAEEELGDATRSETYGREIVINLSKRLNSEYGRGFDRSSLYRFAQFYKTFPDIVATASRQSSRLLTWSHYSELLRVDDPEARSWYEKEALDQSWAVKTLRRNINTQYYYRLLVTADARKAEVEQEMCDNTAIHQADRLEFV